VPRQHRTSLWDRRGVTISCKFSLLRCFLWTNDLATHCFAHQHLSCFDNQAQTDDVELINVDSHDVENQADNVANASINPSISSLDEMAFDPFTWLAIAAQTLGLAPGSWNLRDKINEIMSKNSSAEEKQKEIFEFIEKRLAELETAVAEKEKALIYKDGALAAFEMSFDKATRTGYSIGYGDASAGIARRPEYTATVALPRSLAPNTGILLVPTSNVSTQSLVGGLSRPANTGNRPGPTLNGSTQSLVGGLTGCYLVFDARIEGNLVLQYSEGRPQNAVGLFVPGMGHNIEQFKIKRNEGKCELPNGIAGRDSNRRNYYSGWCEFLKLAFAKGGLVMQFNVQQGVAVDMYGYRKYEQRPELIDLASGLGDVSSYDAVAVVPKDHALLKDVKSIAISTFLKLGNSAGASKTLKCF
jgi:Immune Mapped Protein 2 (IMP2) N-terminal domain